MAIDSTGTALTTDSSFNPSGIASTNPANNVAPVAPVATAKVTAPVAPIAPVTTPTPKTQSTTTLSSDKTNDITGITSKTNGLSQTGVTTTMDSNGNPISTNANGTVYNPPTPPEPSKTGTNQTGDTIYVGDTAIPAGSEIPKDASGNSMITTPLPKTSQDIIDKTNALISKNDSNTATLLQNIQNQYKDLINQQQKANASAIGAANFYAVNGGQGVASASDVIQGAVTEGLNSISNLVDKETSAITQAQIAGDNQDYQLQDKINTEIDKIRTEKQDAAIKLSDTIAAAKKTADATALQATKDSAITSIISPTDGTAGLTDPAQILATLQKNGNKDITLADVSATLKNIADANNTQVDKLSGNVKDFNILKGMPGGLPASITSLPADQQMGAYLKMINPVDQKGTYTIHDNPDGSQSVLNTATGQLMGGGSGSNGIPTNMPEVAMTGTGNPNPSDQNAFLATLPKAQQTLVKGLADYTINPASFPTRFTKGGANGGLTQQQALALVAQYDPTYDSKQYATRASMQKNVTSGQYSQAINSANKVIAHLADLQSTVKALSNMGSIGTPLNAGLNAVGTFFGGAKQNNFNIAATAVSNELAKVFKGTGSSDMSEIETLKATLSSNNSPAQQEQAINQFITLMGGQLSTLASQYNSVMGKPGNFQILTPASVVTLKSMGIDPSTVDPTYNSQTDVTGSGKSSLDLIQTFHDASPDNAKKIDDLHTQFPNASADDIRNALGLQ